MPRLRVYGHEFLAQRCLVQLSLGHPFSRSLGSGAKVPPVKLYSRSGQDPLHLWSSLKLVMTSKSDISAVPHSVILPLPDEREVFTFQVASLERFTLELSLYPTFGSKVIGRAIILPSTFLDIRYHKGFVAPLLDHHLKTIGEVAFEVSCIRPFQGAQLEIGGRVETYWKSKVAPTAPTQDHAHQYQAHRPPSVRPAPNTASSTNQPKDNTLVTASSLSGEYINVVVQVTKDGVPVVYPEWRLPVGGLDVGVPDVTYAQFTSLAASTAKTFAPPPAAAGAAEWYTAISTSLASLQDVLEAVPPGEMGLNLQLRYSRGLSRAASTLAAGAGTSAGTCTGMGTASTADIGKSIEVNAYVDSVLHTVYDAAKLAAAKAEGGGRKMMFSSYDPTVCTALNWKQPNCASRPASDPTAKSGCRIQRLIRTHKGKSHHTESALTYRRRLLCLVLRHLQRGARVATRPRASRGRVGPAVPEREGGGQLRKEHKSARCHIGRLDSGESSRCP